MPVPKLRFKDTQEHDCASLTRGTINDYCYELKVTIDPCSTPDKKFIEYSMPAFDNGKTPTTSLGRDMHSARKSIERPCLLVNKLNVRKQRIWLHNREEKNAVCSTEFVALGAKERCCLAYFEQLALTNHFTTYLINNSSGTSNSQKRVSPNTIFNYASVFPSLPEQEKIADFLTTYDRMIDVQSQRVEAMKTRKKGLLQQIFSQEIRFRDDHGQDYPEWKNISIKDIRNKQDSHSYVGGPFGSNLKQSDYTNDGVQIIQLQNIGDGCFIDENKIFTSSTKADELHSCNIFPGDIIMAKMAEPLARACIIPNKAQRYLMASDGIRLSVDHTKFNTYCVMNAINSPINRKEIIKHGTGTTRLRISLVTLGNIQIKMPCLNEQNKIADFLSAVDTQIEVEEKRLETMKTIKKGLLQQMFI